METLETAKSFKDWVMWQKAHALVLAIYKLTRSFPKEEIYCLTSQIRRSSISVAANMAEAFKKKSSADKLRILNIAQGSLPETEYYLILSEDLSYSDTKALRTLSDEVGKILEGYMKAMRK